MDLARLDLDVRHLAARAADGLVDHDARVRQREPTPLAPAASSTAPIEAAMPRHVVRDDARTYCIVS
jgi:hypothetical protein